MPFNLPATIVFQCAAICLALAFMAGHRFEIINFKVSFLGFALCLLAIFIVGVGSFILSFFNIISLSAAPKLFVLLIAFAPLGLVFAIVGKNGFSVPKIHNVTTNLVHPPEFKKAYEVRHQSHNSLEPLTGDAKLKHKNFYTHLDSVVVDENVNNALEAALRAASSLGWTVYHVDKAEGFFEAYEQTLLFGFKDDIVVRVLPKELQSQLDLRSVSRVGESDLGANAERITQFIDQFRRELKDPK